MSQNIKHCKANVWCDEYGDPYRVQIELTDENNCELIFSDCCGEPEDNSYGRDHADVLDVLTLLQKFYQMGRNDEFILFSEKDLPYDDE